MTSEQEERELAIMEAYPDGFTCDECGEVILNQMPDEEILKEYNTLVCMSCADESICICSMTLKQGIVRRLNHIAKETHYTAGEIIEELLDYHDDDEVIIINLNGEF